MHTHTHTHTHLFIVLLCSGAVGNTCYMNAIVSVLVGMKALVSVRYMYWSVCMCMCEWIYACMCVFVCVRNDAYMHWCLHVCHPQTWYMHKSPGFVCERTHVYELCRINAFAEAKCISILETRNISIKVSLLWHEAVINSMCMCIYIHTHAYVHVHTHTHISRICTHSEPFREYQCCQNT
jgi:hypothetical protein